MGRPKSKKRNASSKKTLKHVRNTNIYVTTTSVGGSSNETINRLHQINGDVKNSHSFYDSLRPENKLIDPAEQFAKATKTLRPAVKFNTFDKQVAKRNRKAKRQKHLEATMRRRQERLTPNPTLKSSLNPKKLPPTKLQQQQDGGDDVVLDEARLEREDVSKKLGLRVKKLGKARNRKDFRDPRERKTIVGDEL